MGVDVRWDLGVGMYMDVCLDVCKKTIVYVNVTEKERTDLCVHTQLERKLW